MNKIDKYILKSFIGPFILTFFITLFILLIQFLWKYVDDLVGKGLEWYIIAKLLFYASANMVPLAMPIAVLLSSIMTYGSMGEKFELAAFKSAGISMFRFMRSTIIAVVFISIGAFLFSNYVLPRASLKFYTTLIDITRQKPALNIKTNEFYNEIENYSILIGHKNEDNIHIQDVTIYEEKPGSINDNVLIAQKGEMYSSEDKKNLVMKLYNGKQYEEMAPDSKNTSTKQHMRMNFGSWEKTLDLSGFEMQHTNEDMYSSHYKMLNVHQLHIAIDSLQRQANKQKSSLPPVIGSYFVFNRDTTFTVIQPLDVSKLKHTFIENMPEAERRTSISRSLSTVRNISGFTNQMEDKMKFANSKINDHKIEWHRKFVLSFACFLFLFIGAPLGAIIRKGGFGMPVLFSIVIFIFFYIINITGERLADENVLSPFIGMWLAIFIIFPFGVLLTQKAKNDSPVFNGDWYSKQWHTVKHIFLRQAKK